MAKTLNELAGELKDAIIDAQSDAHNKKNMNAGRYNNLKLKMDPQASANPEVVINLAMSEATFNLKYGEKVNGSLGPDERYVLKWLGKTNTLPALNECWLEISKKNNEK